MKNQFKEKNLLFPIDPHQATQKSYVDDKLNDLSKINNTGHVNFNNHKLDNVRFVKVSSYPAVQGHLRLKYYLNEAVPKIVDESSFLRLDN